jgi:hypothetical protein
MPQVTHFLSTAPLLQVPPPPSSTMAGDSNTWPLENFQDLNMTLVDGGLLPVSS